jgi:hypothetical protein
MILRIEIAPDDFYEGKLKTFDDLTVADFITMVEFKEDEHQNPLERDRDRIMRFSGAPKRFVSHMTLSEVDEALGVINRTLEERNEIARRLHEVNTTFDKWAEEHSGSDYTVEDAQGVFEQFGLFRDSITIDGQTFTAPQVEVSAYGKWIDLQGSMDKVKDEAESLSYVEALSIMMEGEDGPYPVQGKHETDAAYGDRCYKYTDKRKALFMQCRWIDVMGIAAFFFAKWERFALITGHNMTRFRSLSQHRKRPERQVIPSDGEFLPS